MKTTLRSIGLAAAGLLATAAFAAENTELSFQYRDGEKSVYDLTISLDVTTSAMRQGRKEMSQTNTTMSLAMDVVDHMAEGEAATLGVTFHDLKLDQKITAPAGSIEVGVDGADVTVKRGGSPVIDTKNKVGADLAVALLGQFAFLDKEGTITPDADGGIGSISGPDEFKRFMTADLKSGLFLLSMPTAPVAETETWETQRTISSLRGLDFSASPIAVKTAFTLKSVTEKEGKKIATIAVESNVVETENLSAKGTGGAFDGQTILIPEVKRTATGIVLFDVTRGTVVESNLSVDLNVKIKVAVEGEDVETAFSGTGTVKSKLR